ncbi:MAG: DUF1415 domain-containing protein [Ramlibacter sp.]|nr:DUF1415 domain-containing protein [Ramlibacter sp.]MBX3658349.1 DUF1415 domain-containing protein [Ramlibacter sp.]
MATRVWVERAVIGLNLCPFAKAVHVKGQIHYALSDATEADGLLEHLEAELRSLKAHSPDERDTTLLVAPACLHDFWAFNDFMARADRLLKRLRMEGEFQIASFHPAYQFSGTEADDIANYTNRSPYPTLHLLRESSIDRAVQAFPDAETIFGANMQTLRALGLAGWNALDVGARP